jgi:epoxide hydrolase-like predicted phosphatase
MEKILRIKAVLFDMGGVILKTEDHSIRGKWAQKFGMDEKQLSRLVFDNEAAKRATLGLISDDELWTEIYAMLKITPDEGAIFRKEFFSGDQMDTELIRYIDALRPLRRTGLLSNAWLSARNNISSRFPQWNVFDEVIFSAEIHLAKPDPKIFDYATCKINALPEETIFVDDQPENIDAANAFGIHGIRYINTEKAIHEINRLLNP